MIIERKGNDFCLTYEESSDKPERDFQGGNIEDLICLLCNSIELDFDLPEDAYIDFSGITLFNYLTRKYYGITHQDALDFYKGKPIHLYGIDL